MKGDSPCEMAGVASWISEASNGINDVHLLSSAEQVVLLKPCWQMDQQNSQTTQRYAVGHADCTYNLN